MALFTQKFMVSQNFTANRGIVGISEMCGKLMSNSLGGYLLIFSADSENRTHSNTSLIDDF